jgi:hypothetical protein
MVWMLVWGKFRICCRCWIIHLMEKLQKSNWGGLLKDFKGKIESIFTKLNNPIKNNLVKRTTTFSPPLLSISEIIKIHFYRYLKTISTNFSTNLLLKKSKRLNRSKIIEKKVYGKKGIVDWRILRNIIKRWWGR